jgi:hypothetical protein
MSERRMSTGGGTGGIYHLKDAQNHPPWDREHVFVFQMVNAAALNKAGTGYGNFCIIILNQSAEGVSYHWIYPHSLTQITFFTGANGI